MKNLNKSQANIIKIFISESRRKKALPSLIDLQKKGVTRAKIRSNFFKMENLIKEASKIDSSIASLPKDQDNASEKRKQQIVKIYTDIVKNTKPFPSGSDLLEKGISDKTIQHHFGSIEKLRKASIENNPDVYEGSLRESDLLEKHSLLLSEIKGKTEFIITTAVSGQKVHAKALKTLEAWQNRSKERMVIVLPSLDTAHNLDNEIEWFFDKDILKFPMAFGEVKLNTNFHISDFPVTAKQVNPITGIGNVIQGKGSMVFASPKQSLEFESVSSGEKYPHAGMSTGAITLPNYKSTKGNSQRSAWIAEKHHKMGAIIVEIQNNKSYHFRQIQFDKNGGFHDLGLYHIGNNIVLSESMAKNENSKPIMVRGDYHAGHHDEQAVLGSEEIAQLTGIKTVYDHDFFDGSFCNPHEEDNLVSSLKKTESQFKDGMSELKMVGQEIIRTLKTFDRQLLVDSNHHDFLIRWASKGHFLKNDPKHFDLGLLVINELRAGKDPLVAALRQYGNIPNFDNLIKSKKLVFLSKKEDVKYEDINVGAHGHLGRNGKRNPNKSGLEKGYGKGIFGHSHTSGILRDIVQVGCLEKLRPGYNEGPSGWIHNVAIAYPGGSVQLINIIFGQYAKPDTIKRVSLIRKKLMKK